MKELTIIIPCYNSLKYLKRCLESLENQELRCFDVIIIDDCSTDDTYEWIKLNKDAYSFPLTVLQNEKNIGPSLTRWKGVQMAQTKFISFCDADDTYSKKFVSEMMNALTISKADIVFCGFMSIINRKRKEIIAEHKMIDKKKILDNHSEMLSINIDSLCVGIYKRSLFSNVEFPDIRNGEDMAVIPVLIVMASRIVCLPDCLYNYYYNKNSASMKPSLQMIDSLKMSYIYTKKYLFESYYEECEFIGIRNILYGAILNLLKIRYDKISANRIVEEFENSFPRWRSNVLRDNLSLFKRVFIFFIGKRMFFIARAMAVFHSLVVGV